MFLACPRDWCCRFVNEIVETSCASRESFIEPVTISFVVEQRRGGGVKAWNNLPHYTSGQAEKTDKFCIDLLFIIIIFLF